MIAETLKRPQQHNYLKQQLKNDKGCPPKYNPKWFSQSFLIQLSSGLIYSTHALYLLTFSLFGRPFSPFSPFTFSEDVLCQSLLQICNNILCRLNSYAEANQRRINPCLYQLFVI